MFQGSAAHNVVFCTLITVFSIFCITKCDARHSTDYQKDSSISCYECNSEYDPRCGDPFDPYTIGVVNCSKKRRPDHINLEPTLCRKTVQKVQGMTRIVRGCGYIPDARDNKECVKRSGTHDVQVFYCSCTGQTCNTGHHQTRPSIIRIVLAAISLAISLFHLA